VSPSVLRKIELKYHIYHSFEVLLFILKIMENLKLIYVIFFT